MALKNSARVLCVAQYTQSSQMFHAHFMQLGEIQLLIFLIFSIGANFDHRHAPRCLRRYPPPRAPSDRATPGAFAPGICDQNCQRQRFAGDWRTGNR
jgi:hypothetical protein